VRGNLRLQLTVTQNSPDPSGNGVWGFVGWGNAQILCDW
jgi:hypothetical protein